MHIFLLPPANVVCEGYVFTPVCDSVNTGGRAWLVLGGIVRGCSGGMCGCSGGHVWFFLGGMHGFSRGGMHGFFWGACVVFSRGACIGYDEIRSMSGRYASYWNAFLLYFVFMLKQPNILELFLKLI